MKLAPLFFLMGCATSGSDMTMTDFSVTNTADVTASQDTVVCALTVTSTGAPVLNAGCDIRSPSGTRYGCLATNESDDVWSCAIIIPMFAEAGTYEVSYTFANNATGSIRATGAELLAAFDPDPNLDIVVTSSNEDVTVPLVDQFDVVTSPDPLVAGVGGQVTCTVTAFDTESGLRNASCTFRGPTYATTGETSGCVAGPTTSCSFDVPPNASEGSWVIQSVTAEDKVFNSNYLKIGDITLLGGSIEYVVSGTGGTGGTGGTAGMGGAGGAGGGLGFGGAYACEPVESC